MDKIKKVLTFSVSLLLLLNIKSVFAQPFNEFFRFKNTELIGPATYYEKYSLITDAGYVDIHCFKINLKDKGIYIDTVSNYPANTGNTVLNMLKENISNNPIAGINSNFFYTNTKTNYNRLWPIGLSIKNGKILSSPNAKSETFPSFYIAKNGSVNIAQINLLGLSLFNLQNNYQFKIAHINKFTGDLTYPIFFTGEYVNSTIGNKYKNIVEIIIKDNTVIDIRKDMPSINIDKDTFYLAATNNYANNLIKNFNIGDKIELKIDLNIPLDEIFSATSGNTFLILNGNIQKFSHEITGRHPRSAVGYDIDKNWLYLVSVDGRNDSSIGMTQEELAIFLKSIGVYNAINLDGGYSSQLIGISENGDLKQYNNLSPTRNVFDALAIFYKYKEDKVNHLKINVDSPLFEGENYSIKVNAFDKFNNPLPLDVVNLAVYQDTYKVESLYNFTPYKSGIVTLNAVYQTVYGSVYQEKKVSVFKPEYIKISPSSIYFDKQEEKQLKFYIADKFGHVQEIDSKTVLLSTYTDDFSFGNGLLKVNTDSFQGVLEFSYKNLKGYLPVGVGVKEKTLFNFDTLAFYRPDNTTLFLSKVNKVEGLYSNKVIFNFKLNKKTFYLNFKKPIDVPNYKNISIDVAASNCNIKIKAIDISGNTKMIPINNKLTTNFSTTTFNVDNISKILSIEVNPTKLNGYIWLDNLKGVTLNYPKTEDLKVPYLHSTANNSKDSIFIFPFSLAHLDKSEKEKIIEKHLDFYKSTFSLYDLKNNNIKQIDKPIYYENANIIYFDISKSSITNNIAYLKVLKSYTDKNKYLLLVINKPFDELPDEEKDILLEILKSNTKKSSIVCLENNFTYLENYKGIDILHLSKTLNTNDKKTLCGAALNLKTGIFYLAD
ncbi:phosphodiester glycosidase family protein [Caldicellulosiruptoraceae bacterium PP1]